MIPFFVGEGERGAHPAVLKDYLWLCTQELLVAMLKGPYNIPGIEPGSATCDMSTHSTILSQGHDPNFFLLTTNVKIERTMFYNDLFLKRLFDAFFLL